MNDLISRQAAIDAICNACGKIDCDKMDKCEKLQLPPANCSEFPNNSDTISRQAAIDALDCINGTEEVLRSLPSTQPTIEPRKGEWVKVYHNGRKTTGHIECSICGWWRSGDWTKHNFCPNCGADMREVRNELD